MTALEIAKTFEDCAIDHEPDGWPAVQQKELSEAAAMLRKQAEAIKQLREALYMIQGDKRTCIQLDGHISAALAATENL